MEQDYKQGVRWLSKQQYLSFDALLMLGECAAMGIDIREHRDAALDACAAAKNKGLTLEKPKDFYRLPNYTIATM